MGSRPAILLFAVLFSPKSYHFKDHAIDYLINDLCMIALFFIGLASRLGSPDSIVAVRPLGADGTEAAAA